MAVYQGGERTENIISRRHFGTDSSYNPNSPAKFPSVPIFLVCVPISLNSLNVQNSAILDFDHF